MIATDEQIWELESRAARKGDTTLAWACACALAARGDFRRGIADGVDRKAERTVADALARGE